MPYLNLDLDYFNHPKTVRLIGLLGAEAAVIPIRLWVYVGKYHCERGVLPDYSSEEVESLAGWCGEKGKCVSALVKVGFLEQSGSGFIVHDWKEHAGHLASFKVRSKKANYKRWKDLKEAANGTRSQRLAKARKKGKHTPTEWEGMKNLFEQTCVRCLSTEYCVEKDHIVPLYLGGSDGIENIQPVCAKCNASKTGDTKDYRLTYLIHKGKSQNTEEAKRLLECLLDALRMPPPNHTYLNHTKPKKEDGEPPTIEDVKSVLPETRTVKLSPKRQALEDFTVTDDLRTWAREKHGVELPDEVLREFKDHWRKEPDKKLRQDWTATFQMNVNKLVGWGTLKPINGTPRAIPTLSQKCQERVQRGNFLKPCGEPSVSVIGGRPLCLTHKEHHVQRQHASSATA